MDRFWSKVRKSTEGSGCWLWTGASNNKGYGVFHIEPGVTTTAHKYSYKLAHPYTKIEKGMALCVLHTCDNRRCVNPDHLRPGTPKSNTRDMVRKDRAGKPSGKAHGNSKLTWAIVRNIRQNYRGEYGELTTLCVRYGVQKATLRDVMSSRSWKETKGE